MNIVSSTSRNHPGSYAAMPRLPERVWRLAQRVAARLGVALACSVVAANVHATTYVPNTFTDPAIASYASVGTVDGHIGATATISLRSAVIAANQHAGADTITLAAGTYVLSIAPVMNSTFGTGNFHKAAYSDGTGSKYALNGSLDVTDSLTINGAGQALTIIDGGGPNSAPPNPISGFVPLHDMIFTLNPYNVATDLSAAVSGIDVTLSNLTLRHGDNPSDDGVNGYAAGGAIWWEAGWNHMATNTGSLTLTNATVDSNRTTGGGGGLVVYNGGTLTFTNSTFSNNVVHSGPLFAGTDGGAIILADSGGAGTATFTGVDITGNQCTPSGGAGGSGGGIEVVQNAYAVTIHGGSISNNTAPSGGGIYAHSTKNVVIDQNTTISGNSAAGAAGSVGTGGGILADATITVKAGTVISGNHATGSGGGATIGGGSSITQSSVINNTAGIAGGGVYVFSGPDAGTVPATPAVALPFDRIFGNTAVAGGSQVDSSNELTGFNDVWVGSNVPAASTIVGAGNAVAITSIGPDTAGGTVSVTTAAPHGFATGQGVAIDGVAVGTYNGFAGCYVGSPPTAFAGITVTGPNTFTFCSHLVSGSKAASSGGQASQTSQIIGASESGSTVTITVTQKSAGWSIDMPHKLVVGQVVRIQGIIAAAAYNGEFVVTGVPTSTSFTYTAAQTGLPTQATGTTVYGSAIPLVNNNVTTAAESGSTVTLTLNSSSYGFALGNLVSIAGVGALNSGGYNGAAVLTGVSGSTVTFTSPTTGLAGASNGNITKLADSILQFKLSASPNVIRIGDTSALTASFLSDSANNVISPSNLGLVIGLPIAWTPGSLGTLSGQQATVQGSGTATATFHATASGLDIPTAQVDNPPAATTVVTVLFPPSIGKAFAAAHIPVAGTTTLTFTITNPNTTHALSGLAFSDALPSGLAVANAPNTATTCGGSVTAAAGATSLSFSGGTISFNAAGTLTCTVSVDVKGVSDGLQNNTSGNVSATDLGGLTGNTASASVTVINPPAIAKAFGAPTIPLNGSASLTFTVTSSNASLTLNGVAFTDSLPAGLVVSTPGNLSSNCGGTATAADGSSSASLSGATLAPGASCTLSLNVKGTTAGVKNNSVTASSTNAGNGNTSNASLTVVAPPTIAKLFGAASMALNGTTSLSFTINNPNTSTTLTGIGFSDTLPGGLAIATPNGQTGSCGGGTITATQNTIIISLAGASLAASASCNFAVNVKATGAGLKTNTTGNITSVEGGTGATAMASVTVNKFASTTALTTACPTSFVANQAFTMTATVTGYSPTGTTTFDDGAVSIGGCTSVALSSGAANCMTSTLPMGTDNLTAAYSGDSNNDAGTSPSLNVTVLDPTDVLFRSGLEALIAGCPSH